MKEDGKNETKRKHKKKESGKMEGRKKQTNLLLFVLLLVVTRSKMCEGSICSDLHPGFAVVGPEPPNPNPPAVSFTNKCMQTSREQSVTCIVIRSFHVVHWYSYQLLSSTRVCCS